jgi:hypothetical protein
LVDLRGAEQSNRPRTLAWSSTDPHVQAGAE